MHSCLLVRLRVGFDVGADDSERVVLHLFGAWCF